MIEVMDLEKNYGTGESRCHVLRGVSLTVQDGDFAVILGASGSGKSTLLNLISGLERPDAGRVCYDGRNITALSDTELTAFRRATVGFVFQQYFLLPHMNVEQNVKMGATLSGNRDFREIIRAVGLEKKMHKYPGELSGGEQQRVAVARALAKKPQVLFLDEPTGALDEQTGRQVLDHIVKLQAAEGFSVVMVTHNQNIADMARTVICMKNGIIERSYTNPTPKGAYEIGW